jgi:hypothetical protein
MKRLLMQRCAEPKLLAYQLAQLHGLKKWLRKPVSICFQQNEDLNLMISLIRGYRTCQRNPVLSGNGSHSCAAPDILSHVSYAYEPSTAFAPTNFKLLSTTADPAGLAIKSCYQYDDLGNMITTTEARGAC